jgi:vancomycin permeability regulator SanA
MIKNKQVANSFIRSRKFYVLFCLSIVLFIGLVVGVSYGIVGSNQQYVLGSEAELGQVFAEEPATFLVLGSAVSSDGQPKGVLQQRLDATLRAYSILDTEKIIVSGYASRSGYSEPIAMRDYLVEQGVAMEKIVLDEQGVDTNASCENTVQVLGDGERVLVVTQPSHIDRALFLCRSVGLEAFGYSASNTTSGFNRFFQSFREAFANVKAVIGVGI